MRSSLLLVLFTFSLSFSNAQKSFFESKKVFKYTGDTASNYSIEPGAAYGRKIANIGDLDNDGINELAVCAHEDKSTKSSKFKGVVHIHFFDASGEIKSTFRVGDGLGGFNGKLSATFAMDVAGTGDLDGNGVNDIIVSEQNADNSKGALWVLFLGKFKGSGLTVLKHQKIAPDNVGGFSAKSSETGQNFGNALENIGDLDGDGIDEIAAGSARKDNLKGSIWILFLKSDGTVKKHREISSNKAGMIKLNDNEFFGVDIASMGDLNGDKIPDIAVGAHQSKRHGANTGSTFILNLNKDGSVKKTTVINGDSKNFKEKMSARSFSGMGLCGTIDLNGDGQQDLLMGAFGNNNNKGAIYAVYLNSKTEIDKVEKITPDSYGFKGKVVSQSARFGIGICDLGDLSGDGEKELIIGARDEGKYGAFYMLYSGLGATSLEGDNQSSPESFSMRRFGNTLHLTCSEKTAVTFTSIKGQILWRGSIEAFENKTIDLNEVIEESNVLLILTAPKASAKYLINTSY